MKISESWISQWVDLPNRDVLLEQLTMLGLEVDGIENVSNEFDKVIIGKVISCEKHPLADKLQITKVDIGSQLLDIVCGASNCRLGLKVCVATEGAKLSEDFIIKPVELRGVPSNGMLCSYKELGINIEEDGIIELDNDAPIGEDVRKYLKLDDVQIDISITPNRADCFSILGIARDLASKNNTKLRKSNVSNVDIKHDEIINTEIENNDDCNQFATRIINKVNVKAKTPDYIKQYLNRCGIRSIDPIVDITNYVMIEYGQPSHAYDKSKVNGKFIIRRANNNENLLLLSEQEVSLNPNVLVVADETQPLCLAGIFGGFSSGVRSDTKDIILEVANFNPLTIINRSRQFGLSTDSSMRFERGVDPKLVPVVMEVLSSMIIDICGGEAGPVNIVGNASNNINDIKLDSNLLDRIIGVKIDHDNVTRILESLGCKVEYLDKSWKVKTPSWRYDLNIPEDLVEEVIRINGYDNVPLENPISNLVMNKHRENNLDYNKIKELLVLNDFQEIISYTFVDPKLQDLIYPNADAIILPNPISVEMSAMRLSLFTGLLNTLSYNQSRQQRRVRLFESGLIFTPDSNAENGVRQEKVIGGLISGNKSVDHWSLCNSPVDFFDLKGVVEDIFSLTDIGDKVVYKKDQHNALHPGQSAGIYLDDKKIGIIGVLHPLLCKPFKVSGSVVMFEILSDALLKTNVPQVKIISKFPSNNRDISILVSRDIAIGDILLLAKKVGGDRLIDIKLFDVFYDDSLSLDKKSVAITLNIGDSNKTLEDIEIQEVVDNILNKLKDVYNVQLREV